VEANCTGINLTTNICIYDVRGTTSQPRHPMFFISLSQKVIVTVAVAFSKCHSLEYSTLPRNGAQTERVDRVPRLTLPEANIAHACISVLPIGAVGDLKEGQKNFLQTFFR